mgnify:CR=1 FL=1
MKAALSGVATSDIAQTLAMANEGYVAGYLQLEREARPLPLELRLDPRHRVSEHDFERLLVKGRQGVTKASTDQGLDIAPQPLVPMGELGSFERGLSYINWEVIFLVMCMMIIIAVVERTGIFQWMAYQAYRISRGRLWLLLP